MQVPDILDAGYFFPQPTEDVRLKFMVIGAAAMRVFGVSAGRGKVSHLKALVPHATEEGYCEFQPLELTRERDDLGVNAIL